jgi:hypothetical protein
MARKDNIKNASEAHTNLTIFHAVIAILEGGCIYGQKADNAAQKIIKACKCAAYQQLKVYDAETKKASASTIDDKK